MYPKPLQRLIDLLTQFPGIGPRQAARFAFFILKENGFAGELSETLTSLQDKIGFCAQCFRTVEISQNSSLSNVPSTQRPFATCNICGDGKREQNAVAVVEKESDLNNMEKTGAYRGLYHVLGGVLSPLDSDSPKRLHLADLHRRVKNVIEKNGGCEVVLATSTTTEGDLTALYIERILAPLKEKHPQLSITRLGRGLSLGSELEYADEVTLKNALNNRR